MKQSEVDALIVGGGPAGLCAALALKTSGVQRIRIVDRESQAGGVPRHSFHLGYGIRDLHRLMNGPAYARTYVQRAVAAGIEISTSTTAIDWADDLSLALTSPLGMEEVRATKIVLATGARERGRSARSVPGSRPAGIYTTGALQQAHYLHNQSIGERAVIVGADHVSFSAVITLAHAGVKTVAMITNQPSHQSYFPFRWGTALRYRYPLLTNTTLIEILGSGRVSAVRVRNPSGERFIECDTVVFTADWIPDNELARLGEINLDPKSRSPLVNENYESSRPGVYALGNLLLPIKAADECALQARMIVRT